jgi:hypothetical protein
LPPSDNLQAVNTMPVRGWNSVHAQAAVTFAATTVGASVPVFAASVAIALIYGCITVAKEHGHIPQWLDTPPISLAGIHEPEVYAYKIGFPIITLLFLLLELPFTTMVRASLESAPELIEQAEGENEPKPDRKAVLDVLDRASLVARVAFVCLGVQGVVPLQGWGDVAGLVHVMGANVFFMTSIYHGACVLWCLGTDIATSVKGSLPIAYAVDSAGWYLRCLILAAAFFPTLPAMLLHPGTQAVDPDALRSQILADAISDEDAMAKALEQANYEMRMETAGFSQWWMVGMIIAYYTLYARDLYMMGAANKHRVKPDHLARGVRALTLLMDADGDADHEHAE